MEFGCQVEKWRAFMCGVPRGVINAEMLCKGPHRGESVYPEFSEKRHVKALEPDGGLTWIGGMDFGYRGEMVFLWAQVRVRGDGKRRMEVVREYVEKGFRLGDFMDSVEALGMPRPSWLGVDPTGDARNLHTGMSTIDVLKGRGYAVRFQRAPVIQGIDVVRRYLEGDRGGERLLIDPKCRRLIEGLTKYHFDPDDPSNVNPVKDGSDHVCDALRYMLTNMPGWKEAEWMRY